MKFTQIKALLEFNEILVSLSKDEADRNIFAMALSNVPGCSNPYLLIDLGNELAHRVANGAVDALSCILTPATPEWHVVDMSPDVSECTIFHTYQYVKDIPATYMPSNDLYFRV